ncbi:transposase [Pseudomonas lini]
MQVELGCPDDRRGILGQGNRPAKPSTESCKARTWCALKFKWAPVRAFKQVFHAANTPFQFQSFKAQVIQECAEPGGAIASIALSHSLYANLVHKWTRVKAQKSTALQPAFIPLPMQVSGANSLGALLNICVEFQHPRGTIKLNWPTESAAASVTSLQDVLR